MDATNNKNPLRKDMVSEKFAQELKELATNSGYDSIRFFISPDKKVSPQSIIEDVRAFFIADKTNEGMEMVYSKR